MSTIHDFSGHESGFETFHALNFYILSYVSGMAGFYPNVPT